MLAMETEGPLFWVGFNAFVLIALFLDLFVLHRKSHDVKIREALLTTAVWVMLALGFGAGVYFTPELGLGPAKAKEFIAGYLIEQSLSVDNLFVFVIIFTYFKVPLKYQHRLLFWGVMGALVMRGIFIFAGVALIARFHFLIYLFGGFLIFTGVKLGIQSEKEPEPQKNPIIRLLRKLLPVDDSNGEGRFFIVKNGKRYVTQLFLVLVLVEATDLLFAMDSIPAVLAISNDPFVIYTSNVFAIMGLRSLYFALAGIMGLFQYLKYGLSVILTFVGIKMLFHPISDLMMNWGITDVEYVIPIELALGVIAGTLAVSVAASLLFPKKPVPVEVPGELPDVKPEFEQPEPEATAAPEHKT